MTVYVLNTLIVPVDFDQHGEVKVKMQKISIEEAKALLSKGFISAVGHESTAKVLSHLLGIEIPANRVSIFFEPGDVGVHFFLKTRLPEGRVLTEEELKKLDFWLVKSQVLVEP